MGCLSSGFPETLRLTSCGSNIGRYFFSTGIGLPFLSYTIGIGQPQYLCLETPQSLSLKVIFFVPIFFCDIILIAFSIALGTVKPFKNLELNSIPSSVNAMDLIPNFLLLAFCGLTTGKTLSLYLFAKSKSLWSWAGHPNIAPVP